MAGTLPPDDDPTAPTERRSRRMSFDDHEEAGNLVAPPPRRASVAVMGLVLAGLMVGTGLTVLRPEDSGPASQGPGRPATAQPSPSPTPDDPEEAPEPAGIHAVLDVSIRSWAEATVDGSSALEEVLEEGRRVELDAREQLELMLGNAGGVRLEINGEEVPTGDPGEVVRLWFGWQDGRLVRG